MVVDTGSDACYFDHNLAYTIGVNPVQGGTISEVRALTTSHPTAVFPVRIVLPQLEMELDIEAEFTQLPGWNGLLGHVGFLEHFERVTFVPGQYFELVPLSR